MTDREHPHRPRRHRSPQRTLRRARTAVSHRHDRRAAVRLADVAAPTGRCRSSTPRRSATSSTKRSPRRDGNGRRCWTKSGRRIRRRRRDVDDLLHPHIPPSRQRLQPAVQLELQQRLGESGHGSAERLGGGIDVNPFVAAKRFEHFAQRRRRLLRRRRRPRATSPCSSSRMSFAS